LRRKMGEAKVAAPEMASLNDRATAATDPARHPTIGGSRHAWAAQFRTRGIDSAELDARLLIGHALGFDHAALAARAEQVLDSQQLGAIAALARRRLHHEPVARIIGAKQFWTLRLRLGEATLVPRPETETVVEAALAALEQRGEPSRTWRSRTWRIADVGTGSGAILLALLSELPNSLGVGTDIDSGAIAIARANAADANLTRAAYLVCDMASALRGPFDLILSNPPYIPSGYVDRLPPEIRLFDPPRALDGGSDGLDHYRALAATAPALLVQNGIIVVELGHGQAEPVAAIFSAAGLAPLAVRPDLNGIARALVAKMSSARSCDQL
jgi:release factor glutamine methyltransferase